MADKENCLRVMRSMKRRPEAAVTPEQPSTKKRVVLGELLNAVVPTNKMSGAEKQIQKPGAKGKAKKAVPLTKTIQQPEAANDVDAVSDDPQMCAPYARDIYEYLQKLEAHLFRRSLKSIKTQKALSKEMSPNRHISFLYML